MVVVKERLRIRENWPLDGQMSDAKGICSDNERLYLLVPRPARHAATGPKKMALARPKGNLDSS